MAWIICGRIAQLVQVKIKYWTLQLLPLLIVMNYVQAALQSLLHLRLEAETVAQSIASHTLIGILYVVFDICIILVGSGLIVCRSRKRTGISLLMLHHMLQCIKNLTLEQALKDFVDIGALLLLLALRPQQKTRLELLLLLARSCMSCIYLLLWRAKNNNINGWFALVCCILLLIGFKCRFVACLAAITLMWHACCLVNWSFIFGWNDLTISVSLICSLFGKVAGFLLMARLGAGKWSLDART